MSSYNWNNFVLYIKRAELKHDEEYITNALEIIGDVKSVSFISKTNEKGHKYNGAIVHFNNMNIGPDLYQIIEQFETNEEKTAKIYHTEYRYWIVNEYIDHSSTEISNNIVSPQCSSNEQLVFEYNILQKRCEKQERKMMEYEEQLTRKWFENVDLQIQVDKKDCLIEWKNRELQEQKEKYEKKISENETRIYHMEKISDENHKNFARELANSSNQKVASLKRIECLEQELELVYNMLAYYEQKYGNYIDVECNIEV